MQGADLKLWREVLIVTLIRN